jgi:hypothetical protein
MIFDQLAIILAFAIFGCFVLWIDSRWFPR